MSLFPPVNNFWGYKKCFVQTWAPQSFFFCTFITASGLSCRWVGRFSLMFTFSILTWYYMLHEIAWKTSSGILQLVSTFISWRFYHALPPELSAGCPVISASLPIHVHIPIRGQVRQGLTLDCRFPLSLLCSAFCLCEIVDLLSIQFWFTSDFNHGHKLG